MPKNIISIVGLSGSGKTTVLEKLITELSERGLKVGTIKHSCHPHPVDAPGKDSWRHREAGAVSTIFIGPEAMQFVTKVTTPPDSEDGPSPESLTQEYLADMDIVLVEGFHQAKCPRLEVVRKERSLKPFSKPSDGLVALITDVTEEECDDAEEGSIAKLPRFGLNDIADIADFIEETLGVDSK